MIRQVAKVANVALRTVAVAAMLAACGGGVSSPTPSVVGLTQRPVNLTCLAPPRPDAAGIVAVEDAFPSVQFSLPVKILQAPNISDRWYVLEKAGIVRTISAESTASVATFLDLRSRVYSDHEGGLLGMAFHPGFPGVPQVFLAYTTPAPGYPGMKLVLSRFILDEAFAPTGPVEEQLLAIDQSGLFHKGGEVNFGPDGLLYFSVGDGGLPADEQNDGQDPRSLRGKILRIDATTSASGYSIPAGNPNASNPKCGPAQNVEACPEVYASGFRNPWRWQFDVETGKLWVGDVGDGAWEEVSIVVSGGNYGWRCREGSHDFIVGPDCPPDLIDPVAEYAHADGNAAIVGGFVYRGTAIPALRGRYVFADFGSGRLFALADGEDGKYQIESLVDTPYDITALAEGVDREIYFTDYTVSQKIHKVVAAGSTLVDLVPERLQDSGCVSADNPRVHASSAIPYSVLAPLWSDSAEKTRYFAIPDGATVQVRSGKWTMPPGTVVVKNFFIGGMPVETRLLMRHMDGIWGGYTYEWNEDGTSAERVRGGKLKNFSGQLWEYPSEGECFQCHTGAAGVTLGLESSQLALSVSYAENAAPQPQLEALTSIGILDAETGPPGDYADSLVDPMDESANLDKRGRSYLHANCSQCHRPNGPTPSAMDLRITTPFASTNTCNVVPSSGSLGIPNARLIAPGNAELSILVNRMARRDGVSMPPLASHTVDEEGVRLITLWINQLISCS